MSCRLVRDVTIRNARNNFDCAILRCRHNTTHGTGDMGWVEASTAGCHGQVDHGNANWNSFQPNFWAPISLARSTPDGQNQVWNHNNDENDDDADVSQAVREKRSSWIRQCVLTLLLRRWPADPQSCWFIVHISIILGLAPTLRFGMVPKGGWKNAYLMRRVENRWASRIVKSWWDWFVSYEHITQLQYNRVHIGDV